MRVVVTDADDKKALAAIRTLGKRGVEVTAAGENRRCVGLYSRWAKARLVYPNPVTRFEEYVSFMLDFVSRGGFDCMLPQSGYTCLAASRYRDDFEKHVRIPVPDYEVAVLARDKLEMVRLAQRLGIPVPETRAPSSVDEVRDLAGRLDYPRVIKFRKGTGAAGVRYARSPAELVSLYDGRPRRPDVVFEDLYSVIQEYIPGEIHDVCVLCNHGEPRAALTQVRLRTWPASGGRGVVDRTTDEPELREMGLRLCREIKYHGPAQVEFKLDERDGKPKLMEINARFWGATGAAVEAGIDFPYLAAKMAVDGDVEPVFDYKVGATYRWPFPYDFRLALESEYPLKALREFIRFDNGIKTDIWPSDPLPHLVGLAAASYVRLRRFFAA